MFSGIVECLGIVSSVQREGTNVRLRIQSEISDEAYIDQSISHNGVCLTVVSKVEGCHEVVAIKETIDKSNLGQLIPGCQVNLERSVRQNTRLDGHLVQGHVDVTAICKQIVDSEGSWYYSFSFDSKYASLIVDKGSIAVNGVSLTVIQPTSNMFQVAIIPYTYEHTNFHSIQVDDLVNLEFDIIGKYVQRSIENYARSGSFINMKL